MCAKCGDLMNMLADAETEKAEALSELDRIANMLIEAETAQAELGMQLAGVQVQARKAGAAERAMRRQLDEWSMTNDPAKTDVMVVLDYWRKALGHKTAKCPLNGKRAGDVRTALKHYVHNVDEALEAIDGLALFPYVVPGHDGRPVRSATGKRSQRYDDPIHCLRDEVTVERFRGYAQQAAEDAKANISVVLETVDQVQALGQAWWDVAMGVAGKRARKASEPLKPQLELLV